MVRLLLLADQHGYSFLVFTNLHLQNLKTLHAIHALRTLVLQMIVANNILLEGHFDSLYGHERALIVDLNAM